MDIIFLGDSLTKGQIGASYLDILKKKLPRDNLVNFGKNGDSVVSLYRRIEKSNLKKFDIVFLWIGTNDVYAKVSVKYPIMKKILKTPYSKNEEDFKNHYKKILEKFQGKTDKIFTTSPLFLGEKIDNEWNKKLGVLSKSIEDISKNYSNVEFINIRKEFYKKLEDKKISKYFRVSILKTISDTVFLKTDRQISWKSSQRGLHFTIDGIHLNSKGAEIVADFFYKKIKENDEK